MRLTAVPDTLLERIVLALGLAPTPLADTMLALLLARTIMAATKLGVFDALADGPLTAPQVAAQCGTAAPATEKLLFALAGARYLRPFTGGRYGLAPVARTWLLKTGKRSLRDAVLHRYLDLALMDHIEEFVQTGTPANYHDTLSPEQWDVYQKGQRSHAVLAAAEIAWRTPVPRGARAMLDIGGAHGHYSVALCRRHRRLHSTILDLPAAVVSSAGLLAGEGMGKRVVHRPGNALTEDLGSESYDLVFMANLVHHFDDATNRLLMRRITQALRPGGLAVIVDLIRAESPRQAGQVGALVGFYFAVTSASGTWSFAEMAAWQRDAGLLPRKPVTLLTAPGLGLQAAIKPPAGIGRP